MSARSLSMICLLLLCVAAANLSAGKGKTKVGSLAKCPAWGAEERGSSRAALNEVKHRVPAGTTPTAITIADMRTLQQQADRLVRSGVSANPTARDRAKLHNLTSGTKQFSEGDLVSLVGFIVGKAGANPGESANCYLKGASNNDFEFSIGEAADASPYDGIIGELIPQGRPAGWTLAKLRKLATDARQVQIVGQLMFDTRHVPNPKRGTNHESPRVSTWEIHPVTAFMVCQKGRECDPAKKDEWESLETMADH